MTTAIIIPITDAALVGAFNMSAVLGSEIFTFQFQYNDREGCWYFDLLDDQQTMIRAGIKAVINFPLLFTISSTNRPAGELIFIDTRTPTGQSDPAANLTDLGTNVVLVYVEP